MNRQKADTARSKSDIRDLLPLGTTKYPVELMYHCYYTRSRTRVTPLTICLSLRKPSTSSTISRKWHY